MGMYTELIFGASLKKDTPDSVIQTLHDMVRGDDEVLHDDFPFDPIGRHPWMFHSASYYFATPPHAEFVYDEISEEWKLSVRCNLKNYANEIETFLEWIKPYISGGSGCREMYAIVTYEEDSEPTIYYANDSVNDEEW